MHTCKYRHTLTHTHTHTHREIHTHAHKETEGYFHSGRQTFKLNADHKRKLTCSLKRYGLLRGDTDVFYQVSEIFLYWQRIK
jgi:hypothetical protein